MASRRDLLERIMSRHTRARTVVNQPAKLSTSLVSERLSRSQAVSDEVWQEVARHYDEPALAALIIQIGLINVWNRLNATVRQVAGEWTP
jgi:alkylhydroperoxidase family enzyme